MQLADSPLFEHTGLLFLLFLLLLSLPILSSLNSIRAVPFLLNWPHASTLLARPRCARVFTRPEGYTGFMCAPVYTVKFIRAMYTQCQRYFSIWKASPDPSIAASAIFVPQKKILEAETASIQPLARTAATDDRGHRSLTFDIFFSLSLSLSPRIPRQSRNCNVQFELNLKASRLLRLEYLIASLAVEIRHFHIVCSSWNEMAFLNVRRCVEWRCTRKEYRNTGVRDENFFFFQKKMAIYRRILIQIFFFISYLFISYISFFFPYLAITLTVY